MPASIAAALFNLFSNFTYSLTTQITATSSSRPERRVAAGGA
jgi:hypothetical protein